MNQFPRKWQDHWVEIEIDDYTITLAALQHWYQMCVDPIEASHQCLNQITQIEWERLRLATIITLGHQAIKAVRMIAREVPLGSIRYRDTWN